MLYLENTFLEGMNITMRELLHTFLNRRKVKVRPGQCKAVVSAFVLFTWYNTCNVYACQVIFRSPKHKVFKVSYCAQCLASVY